MQLNLFQLSSHQIEDFLLYIPFLAGQSVYILKRAGFSARAGRAASRWQYVYKNWDILLFRSVLEFILIFMPIRHYSPDQILSLFHIDISGISWLSTFSNPVSSPVSLLAAGIGADGMFDWLVDWASRSPKVPDAIKKWLTEEIPSMPTVK
jgi:hypothetical protein